MGSYAKDNFYDDSNIEFVVIFKDYNNLIDMQLELMSLRRKIDSRVEPYLSREKDFEITNPLVHEIVKYGLEIEIKMA